MKMATIKKAIFAGLTGTVVMTVFTVMANKIHIPKVDFQGVIAGLLNTSGVESWVVYFGVGILLAYLYGAYFRDRLPSQSWRRGVVYGFFLWLVMQLIVLPATGVGFFSGSIAATFGMLLAAAAYGGTVGYLDAHK